MPILNFPWRGRDFCPLGEGKNHTRWRAGARVHIVEARVDSGWGRVSSGFSVRDGCEGSRADLDLQLMGSCTGSSQGRWTPVVGSLWPQHLEESASWCGCGWGPPAYPSSPHPGGYRDPPVWPRSATWICGVRPEPRRPHPAVRGLAQHGAIIQGWRGPWGAGSH